MRKSMHLTTDYSDEKFVKEAEAFLSESERAGEFVDVSALYDEVGTRLGIVHLTVNNPRRPAAMTLLKTKVERLLLSRSHIQHKVAGTDKRKTLLIRWSAESRTPEASDDHRPSKPTSILDDLPEELSSTSYFYVVEEEVRGFLRLLKMAKDAVKDGKQLPVPKDTYLRNVEVKGSALQAALRFFLERTELT